MEMLSNDFKALLPQFNGHGEAYQWFKEKFSDYFILKGSGNLEGEKIYFYHLILDQDNYIKGIKDIENKGLTSGFELSISYYIIIILEDGRTQFIF